MELSTLRDRLDYERDAEHDHETIKIMTPGGRRYDVLSVNWDAEKEEWVIIGD